MFLQSYFVGVTVALLSFYAIYSYKRRRLYKMAKLIPGPNGLPFFGEALSVVGSDHSKAFRSLTGLAKDYATPSKIWYGPYCAIILDNPKDLQIALNSTKCSDKAEVYKFIGLNKGLVVAGGNLWKSHRKLLDPSFNITVLQSFLPIFNEKAKVLIKQLRKRVGPKEFDCFPHMSACTLETLLLTMFRIERDVQSDPHSNKYLNDIDHGTKAMNDRLFKVWNHCYPLFRISKAYKRYEKHVINGVFAIAGDILKEKAQQKDPEQNLPKYKIFIDQLLNTKQKLDEDEMVDEINTLIGAVSLQ
jgi:cytochrome P450 family 4